MPTPSDKGTPIGVTDSTPSLLDNILDKGTPIGDKEDGSENAGCGQEDADAAHDSE